MRVEGRWENGEMKDWRENYGFGPSPGHQRTGCWMKPRAGQPQNLSPCPRALRVNHTRRRYDR